MPPTWSSASSTTTGSPILASRYAAVSPAGPPPSTTVGFSRMSGRASFGGGCTSSSLRFAAGASSLGVGRLLLSWGIFLSGLLVEHSAHSDASGAAVELRHGADALEAVVA